MNMINPKSEGMSLIEVLVAFVILSMTMSVILRINSTTLRNHQVSAQYLKAVRIARSRLEQMAVEVQEADAARQGVDEGVYHWRYRRQPHDAWDEERLLAVSLLPIEETITLSWDGLGGERRVSFTRIGVVRDKP
ncbi:MAG: prepilin-type N-terminal cleavage/methylation domain-containing protein [Candidatus Thiodiazotropha sp. (ex Dulcina madagascariensis)]|nr:prepilin-type N-terminal cleavage/methylation domain-containing protein [Candidatus Thiodiazotropha sp. (ex Epidulcina cf. delphinae)]MCU7933404.1 prepilin-type N-terminal cleavage/methylation domain-containing protein [Candidatus Thiodiazotropha sp. (ex Dulcina madagascariensis)]